MSREKKCAYGGIRTPDPSSFAIHHRYRGPSGKMEKYFLFYPPWEMVIFDHLILIPPPTSYIPKCAQDFGGFYNIKFRKKYYKLNFLLIFEWNTHIFPHKSPGYPGNQKIPKAIARSHRGRKTVLKTRGCQSNSKGCKVTGYEWKFFCTRLHCTQTRITRPPDTRSGSFWSSYLAHPLAVILST